MSRVLLVLLLVAPAAEASDFAIPRTGSLSVQVRHPEGPPWSGAAVILRNAGGLVLPSVTYTDRAGEASFPVLCPGDGYEIRIHAEGFLQHVIEDLSVSPHSFSILLINPNAPLSGSSVSWTQTRDPDPGEKTARHETPWIEWHGDRDPRTNIRRLTEVPERLICPDGVYPFLGLPDDATLRWLRRGFRMRQRVDPGDPSPPFVDEPLRVDGPSQRSKNHSSPTSTSDWPGTSRLSGPL